MRSILGLLALSSLGPAHLGSGDSVRPRDTESVIESIVPEPPDGVAFDIVGSDTFIRVRAIGHRIDIPGYEGEPYLRIAADGVVSVNDASKTTLLNGDRYGSVDMSSFVPSETPVWRVVARDGTILWHDHRSHWMSPKPPAPVDGKGTVQKWVVQMTIDGRPTIVNGTLYLRERASVLWWLLGLVAVFMTIAASLVRQSLARAVLMSVSGAGIVVGALQWFGLPVGVRVTPIMLIFSVSAGLLCAASLARRRAGSPVATAVLTGGATTLMIGAWLCADHVQAAYVPGLDAQWLARGLIPVMLGAGIAGTMDGIVRTFKGE